MDYNHIAIYFFTSTGVGIIIFFVLKKISVSTIKHLFDKEIEQFKIELKESSRRNSLNYDNRFKAVNDSVSILYKCRNAIRDVIASYNSRTLSVDKYIHFFEIAKMESENIRELLYENRIKVSDKYFKLLHDFKNELTDVINLMPILLEEIDESQTDILNMANDSYKKIEYIYESILLLKDKELDIQL